MKVTTIIDMKKKEAVAIPTVGDIEARTGGTVKGLGTTYLNTRITSVPTIMDVKTLKKVS